MNIETIISSFEKMKIVDLSTTLEDDMPAHPSHSRFYKMVWQSPEKGSPTTSHQLLFNEHNGTHVDSFRHYISKDGYEWIDEIPLERFFAPCVTIDARFLGHCETLGIDFLKKFEEANGDFKPGDAVLIDTGWMRYWNTRPNDCEVIRNYPGLSGEAAQYLVEKKVGIVGTDALGIDCWGAQGDPAHHALLGNKVLVVENLKNLSELYGKRGFFMMLPLKIKGGSASPVRPVALIER